MSEHMTNINARSLLNSWLNNGLVQQSDEKRLENFILSRQQEKELPLYLRILTGIGAFIASLCFTGFLSASKIINFESVAGLVLWGVFFVVIAILLSKGSGGKDDTVKHSFLLQASFCAMGIGKILFVMGFAKAFGSNPEWGITLATFIITAATYHVYRMSIDRFLSTLAIFVSLLLNIVSEPYSGSLTEIILNLFFFIQIILAAVLLTSGEVKRDYIPLAYAVACSLCVTVIYFTLGTKIHLWRSEQDPTSLVYINILLTLSLIGAIAWSAGNIKTLKTEPLILASSAAAMLGVISAPGIILSLCLMILGYAKHEKLLLLMGIILAPVFIFLYYYNLNISLMAKSEILVASGVVLLAGRGYLAFKKLDREI